MIISKKRLFKLLIAAFSAVIGAHNLSAMELQLATPPEIFTFLSAFRDTQNSLWLPIELLEEIKQIVFKIYTAEPGVREAIGRLQYQYFRQSSVSMRSRLHCWVPHAFLEAVKAGDCNVVRITLLLVPDQKKLAAKGAPDVGTALHLAVCGGHELTVKVLVRVGGYWLMRIPDPNGRTPLHIAAGNGHPEIVRTLIQGAGDQLGNFIGEQDFFGSTALHLAAWQSRSWTFHTVNPAPAGAYRQIACILLIARNHTGALINVTDKEGNTPLMIAKIIAKFPYPNSVPHDLQAVVEILKLAAECEGAAQERVAMKKSCVVQ